MAGQASSSNNRKAIDSGFCTGNDQVGVVLDEMERRKYDLRGSDWKGTVRSYNSDGIKIGEKSSGAFSGNLRNKTSGTKDEENQGGFKRVSEDAKDSNVFGTLQSFNAGTQKRLQELTHDKELRPKLKDSFYGLENYSADKGPESPHTGTLFSFNVVSAKMDIQGATINSGCYSGKDIDADTYVNKLPEDTFRGTKMSFNVMPGNQIDLKNAKINSGACAGNRP